MPLTSFSSAITGLNNNAQAINVISNNLANLNTTAFKASRTSFAELVGAITGTSDSGNPIQPGLGSTVSGITPMNIQGAVQTTGKTSDAAINGNGFFVVDTGNGQAYTRAGNFSFDPNGVLTTADGFKVMGYPAVNGVINKATGLVDIIVPKGSSLTPKQTGNMSVNANLDSRIADGQAFSTGVQVIDSLGAAHVVTLTFTNTLTTPGVGTAWTWSAEMPASDFGGLPTDPAVQVGTGSLTFDTGGVLDPTTTNPLLSINAGTTGSLVNGSADMDFTLGFMDAVNHPRLTGYAAESNVSSTAQDGYQSGVLKDITINSDGTVAGVYDNGKSLPLAQIALASFPNTEGLGKLKGSTFIASGLAGEPSVGVPGSGGRGTLTGAALESSNVDIATEFTNLIIAQRGYQANSRVITTTDQIYQETVNLKQ